MAQILGVSVRTLSRRLRYVSIMAVPSYLNCCNHPGGLVKGAKAHRNTVGLTLPLCANVIGSST